MRSAPVYLPDFSHIYIEEGAEKYPLSQDILQRFPDAVHVSIPDYKTAFNRSGQDFIQQKKSMKLILAVKKPPFIYESTDILQDAGFENFVYATPLLNCLYNCQYCFLQGMYPSANLVAFVNEDNFFNEVRNAISHRENRDQPLVLSISYNTDLLAFENIIPFCKHWIEFGANQPDVLIEIRTKSALFNALKNIDPNRNVLLSWTLSPKVVVDKYEWDTPPLAKRLKAVRQALAKGWNVRLCFDPIMIVPEWQKVYSHFLDDVFSALPADQIYDTVVGVFRMNKDFFQRARKREPKVDIYYKDYELKDGVLSIAKDKRAEVKTVISDKLGQYLEKKKVNIWNS